MSFVHFMESGMGRVIRLVAGVVLVGAGVGLAVQSGGAWWVLAAVGLVPLTASLSNACLLAPLFHQPLRGAPHGA